MHGKKISINNVDIRIYNPPWKACNSFKKELKNRFKNKKRLCSRRRVYMLRCG
jgi:hypothetical protein